MLKTPHILLLMLITIVAVFAGCATQAEKTAVYDQIVTVSRGSLHQVITPSGNIVMPRSINLTFGSAGKVNDIPVRIGEQVKQGQMLAELDTLTLKAALLQAEINARTARYNLLQAMNPNTKSTSRYGTARDPATIDIRQMQANLADMSMEEARRNLDNAVMKAPFDGTIGAIHIKHGDIVSADTIALRLIDPQQIKVIAQVNEGDIFKINIGAKAMVQVDAISWLQIPGTVSAIGASTSASEGIASYPIEIVIDTQNISSTTGQAGIGDITAVPELREGLTVTVTIITAERNNVLFIPLNALMREGNNTYVLIKMNGTVEKRAVSTGISTWQSIEITNGLKEGELIILP